MALALARVGILLLVGQIDEALDNTFLLIISAAVLIMFVPLERLTNFKTSAFEITLEKPVVQEALAALPKATEGPKGTQPMPVDLGAVKATLERLEPLLPYVRGSRILWVDDKPWLVREERRLIRALGIDIVGAASAERAREALTDDLDFDIVLSDARRRGEEADTGAGARFVMTLRGSKEPHLARIPVVFYSAMDRKALERATAPALQPPYPAQLCKTPDELLTSVIQALVDVRVARPTELHAKRDYRRNFEFKEVFP